MSTSNQESATLIASAKAISRKLHLNATGNVASAKLPAEKLAADRHREARNAMRGLSGRSPL